MAGYTLDEKRRTVAALLEKSNELKRLLGKKLDAKVSFFGRTLREHREELERLKLDKLTNPKGWSPAKAARLNALLYHPLYYGEYMPLELQYWRASIDYMDALQDLEREEQGICLEAAAVTVTDEQAGPNTADFNEHKPLLLSQGAYSTGFNSNSLGSSVRQRVISHHLGTNSAAG